MYVELNAFLKYFALVFSLQVAYNTGYIKVDWKRVEKDINKAKEQLNQSNEAAELNTFVNKVNIGDCLAQVRDTVLSERFFSVIHTQIFRMTK